MSASGRVTGDSIGSDAPAFVRFLVSQNLADCGLIVVPIQDFVQQLKRCSPRFRRGGPLGQFENPFALPDFEGVDFGQPFAQCALGWNGQGIFRRQENVLPLQIVGAKQVEGRRNLLREIIFTAPQTDLL